MHDKRNDTAEDTRVSWVSPCTRLKHCADQQFGVANKTRQRVGSGHECARHCHTTIESGGGGVEELIGCDSSEQLVPRRRAAE